MKRMYAALPLLLLLACQRPEVEAFKRNPAPISVTFSIPKGIPDGEDVRKEYAAALRAKLATRTTVVPEGAKAPSEGAELRVVITEMGALRAEPSPGTVGVVTGVAVGALSAMAGNRDAVFDGFFWGLWAGSNASATRRHDMERLGYRPQRMEAQVALYRAGDPEPLDTFAIEPFEVIDAMDPLRASDREDEFRIREEEAKAFARVVVFRIQERFNWLPLAKPRWYGVTESVHPEDPEPVEPPKAAEPEIPVPPSPEAPKAPEQPSTPEPAKG